MKLLLIALTILPLSLFARVRISHEEAKALIKNNLHNLNHYKEGMVSRYIAPQTLITETGLECKYDEVVDRTILLVNFESINIYVYTEVSIQIKEGSANSNNCDQLRKLPKNGYINLMTNEHKATDMEFTESLGSDDEVYLSDDGMLIFPRIPNMECLLDLTRPILFQFAKCVRNDGVLLSQSLKLPDLSDADLEALYEKLKDQSIISTYPSSHTDSISFKLPLTFGELLKEWKSNP